MYIVVGKGVDGRRNAAGGVGEGVSFATVEGDVAGRGRIDAGILEIAGDVHIDIVGSFIQIGERNVESVIRYDRFRLVFVKGDFRGVGTCQGESGVRASERLEGGFDLGRNMGIGVTFADDKSGIFAKRVLVAGMREE